MKSQPEGSSAWPIGMGLLALILASLFQFFIIFQPLEFLITSVFERDDAYYYLQIARNIAEQNGATFDGIHLSNGVQLLWNLILIVIAKLFADPVMYLRVVLVVCLAFTIISGLLLRYIGSRHFSPVFGDIATFLFAGVMIERWNTLQGMEYSLHLAVILATIIIGLEVLASPRRGLFFGLGLLLTLNYWARLDSVLFSAAIWAVVAWRITRSGPAKSRIGDLLVLTVTPALGAIGYVFLSHAWGGTWLPLSGSVKEFYATHFFDGTGTGEALVVQVKMWIKINMHAALSLVPQNLLDVGLGGLPNPFSNPKDMVILAIIGGVSVFGLAAILFNATLRLRFGPAVRPLLFLLFLNWAHALLSVIMLKDFSHVTRHYYGWFLVFWLIWGSIIVASALQLARSGLRVALATGLIAICTVSYGYVGFNYLRQPIPTEDYSFIRYQLAQELNRDLPEDAVVAAWNAGLLGYFLHRPVINLDGLVNDADFLHLLEKGAPLSPYLIEESVTHLIDHNQRDLTLRYREERDTEGEFRNGIAWEDVKVINKLGAIYVLEFLPAERE